MATGDPATDENAYFEAVRSGVAAVLAHGKSATSLTAGQAAPAFSLRGPEGRAWSSARSLRLGPILLIFFRGTWCRGCKIELAAVERAADDIRSRGATIVAISSDSLEDLAAASLELGLSYPVLSDANSAVAELYGLRWKVPLDLARNHEELSVEREGSGYAVLTVPGRFVIDTDGAVAYADVDPDFTRRLDPSELLPMLNVLAGLRK